MPKLTKQKIPAQPTAPQPPPPGHPTTSHRGTKFSIKSALTLPNLTLCTHTDYIHTYLQNVELSFGLTKFSSVPIKKKKVSQFFKESPNTFECLF